MLISIALALSAIAPADGVTMSFVPSGAVAKAGGYSPVRCNLSTTATGITKQPTGLTAAKFGTLQFGPKTVAIILDEPDGKDAKLFVDTNGDGDLTNDPATEWAPRKNGNATMYFGSAKVDIGKGTPVGINLYRFDPKDPARAALKDTLLYYGDFGYEVGITLDGKEFKTFIAGEPSEKSSLSVDRNGDKKISYFKEIITPGKPFNFTGTTYVLSAANGKFSLAKASEKLALAPMPPDLTMGKKALAFKTVGLDGKPVSFPDDYKGKVVMLDF